MEDKPREDDKLKSMLQQWGAEEAIEEARTLHLRPPLQSGRLGYPTLVKLRWGVLLATILVVLGMAAAVVWWAVHWNMHMNPPAPPTPTTPTTQPAQTQPAIDLTGGGAGGRIGVYAPTSNEQVSVAVFVDDKKVYQGPLPPAGGATQTAVLFVLIKVTPGHHRVEAGDRTERPLEIRVEADNSRMSTSDSSAS